MTGKARYDGLEAVVDAVMTLTGCTDRKLAEMLTFRAVDIVLNYTRRETLPDALKNAVVDLAVIAYGRRGAEGESTRSEGGVSHSFVDGIPNEIKSQLNRFIRAKVVGA